MSKRIEIKAAAQDPGGEVRSIVCTGQVGRTLRALVEAGPRGVTSLEISTWALRTSHYVFILRRRHGLDIETVREPHDGPAGPGTHGRYILKTPVRIIEVRRDREAA
jgi:hypothetical protein